MNPNKNQNPNNSKMPKFNLGWIYALAIIGLVIAYAMGGNSIGGSAGKQASYTKFQTYMMQGYGCSSSIVRTSLEARGWDLWINT